MKDVTASELLAKALTEILEEKETMKDKAKNTGTTKETKTNNQTEKEKETMDTNTTTETEAAPFWKRTLLGVASVWAKMVKALKATLGGLAWAGAKVGEGTMWTLKGISWVLGKTFEYSTASFDYALRIAHTAGVAIGEWIVRHTTGGAPVVTEA